MNCSQESLDNLGNLLALNALPILLKRSLQSFPILSCVSNSVRSKSSHTCFDSLVLASVITLAITDATVIKTSRIKIFFMFLNTFVFKQVFKSLRQLTAPIIGVVIAKVRIGATH